MITKRGHTYWCDFYVRGRRIRRSLKTRDKYHALMQANELKTQLENNNRVHIKDVREALAEYEHAQTARQLNRRHIRHVTSSLSRLIETARITTTSEISELIEVIPKNLAAQTQKHHFAFIAAFASFCRDRRYDVPQNLRKPKFYGARTFQRRSMTDSEQQQLLDTSPRHRSLIYLIALNTGLRRVEITRLSLQAFDLESQVLFVPATKSKNRKAASIPISMGLQAGLRDWIANPVAAIKNPKHLVKLNGLPPVPRSQTLKRDLERAGVPVETPAGILDFHALRTTFITRLCLSSAPLAVVQRLARHADISTTTRHYARVAQDDMRQAMAIFDR